MKYVKKYWIPVVLLIAFIAAWVYTAGNSYSIPADGQAQWIAEHQQTHLETLGAKTMDSSCLADSLTLDNGVEIQLWRFQALGHFFDDILVWNQNDEGNYKLVYEYCIAQAAVDEQEGPLTFAFQVGAYRYECEVNDDLTLAQPSRSLSILAPLLCVVLVVGYIALMLTSLWYRKKEQAKKEAGKGKT